MASSRIRSPLAVGLLVGGGALAAQLAARAWAGEPVAEGKALLFEGTVLALLGWAAAAIGLRLGRRAGTAGAAAIVAFCFGTLLTLEIEAFRWLQPTADPGFLCTGGRSAGDAVAAGWLDAILLQPVVLAMAALGLSAPRSVACAALIPAIALLPRGIESAEPCAPDRTFHLSAIPARIPLDAAGDHHFDGLIYVLEDRVEEVRASRRASNGLRTDPLQPLVLRANAGECLELSLTNRLASETVMHLDGLPLGRAFDPATGESVAPDAAIAPGTTIAWLFAIPAGREAEGVYFLHASEAEAARGLFGAVVVEPEGSRHLHPESGAPLAANQWDAIVAPPDAPAFREFVLFFHDVAADEPVRAINYRAEPRRQGRPAARPEQAAIPILRSYVGEPTRMRLVGAVSLHAPALHPHTGRMVPRDRNDDGGHYVEALGPGSATDLELACEEQGCLPTAGDFTFRCDLPDHADAGMWGVWRVLPSLQPDLAPLPDRPAPPLQQELDAIFGARVGGRALVPRLSIVDRESETALEDWFRMELPLRGRGLPW